MAVKPVGAAVKVNVPPGATATPGAPVIDALAAVGVREEAPAMLPAAAEGATAVNVAATLLGVMSSYE